MEYGRVLVVDETRSMRRSSPKATPKDVVNLMQRLYYRDRKIVQLNEEIKKLRAEYKELETNYSAMKAKWRTLKNALEKVGFSEEPVVDPNSG